MPRTAPLTARHLNPTDRVVAAAGPEEGGVVFQGLFSRSGLCPQKGLLQC